MATVRELLDRLVGAEQLSNDDKEVVYDETAAAVRTLPRENLLDAIDRAVGKSKGRRKASAFILSELTDLPEAVDRIGQMLADRDPDVRGQLVQKIGEAKLRRFAPLLNPIMENDPDEDIRVYAINSARFLKEDVNLPVLLRLAKQETIELRGPLLWALKEYAPNECRPYLKKYFERRKSPDINKEHVVVAAWGLGKMGDRSAIQYLDEMLDDPDEYRPNGFYPGVSLRAAQAIADIFDWDFEWHKDWVQKVKSRFRKTKKRSVE